MHRSHCLGDAAADQDSLEIPAPSTDPHSWSVGTNCGPYIGRLRETCVQPQAQVLICNLVARAKALPLDLLKTVLQRVNPSHASEKARQSMAIRVAGGLLAMSAATVESVWTSLKKSGWVPETQLSSESCL